MLRSAGPGLKAYALPIDERGDTYLLRVGIEGIRFQFGPYPTKREALAARTAVLARPHLWSDYGGRPVPGTWPR